MGVMNCRRHNCDNIMCDRHSSEHGYICNECFDELIALGAETSVEKFMDSSKNYNNEEAALARFNVEFPRNDD